MRYARGMMSTHDFEAVAAAKRKHADFLTSLPHVTGLGVGVKKTSGRETGELAIKVYVDRKVAAEELAEEERVPPRLDDIATDVEVIGPLRAT